MNDLYPVWLLAGLWHTLPVPRTSIPGNEVERLASLYALKILDTPAKERFDRLTRVVLRRGVGSSITTSKVRSASSSPLNSPQASGSR
jgi:hypothetical protein